MQDIKNIAVPSFVSYQLRYFVRYQKHCCSIVCQLSVKIFRKISVANYCSIVCQLSVKIFCKISVANYCSIVCQLYQLRSLRYFVRCQKHYRSIICQLSAKIFCKISVANYCSIICQLSFKVVKIFCKMSKTLLFHRLSAKSFVRCQF